jgi:hypothetical protein
MMTVFDHAMEPVMRWILLAATLLSWWLCFTRHGPGAMAIWLFFGIVGVIATALAFAQARIGAQAQPELHPDLIREQANREATDRAKSSKQQ